MIGRFLECNLQNSRKSQLLHCELIWTFEQQFSLYFHSRSPSQENVNSRQRQTRTGAKCKNFSFLLWFRWTKVLKVHSNRRSIYLDIQTWSLLFTKIWPIRELDLEHVTKISQWESENSDYYLDIGVYCLQKLDQSRSLNSHTWPKLANDKARILIDFDWGAMRVKMSKFIVSKIQPIRLKDLGHVTRIDQSETSILRFRGFLRSTVEAQNIRSLIGQFLSRGLNKKN